MKNIKHSLAKGWDRFSSLNPLYLVAIATVLAIVSIVALRHNNQHMEQLKQAVYRADKSNHDVQGALNNLQAYVTAHMNTDLTTGNGSVYPPIQLEYTYLRLAQAQDQAALSADRGLYTAAQGYCQKLDPTDFSGHNRVPCIEQYVTAHGVNIPNLPASLYEFDFLSPSWSPDLAGWSLLMTVFCFALGALLYAVQIGRKLLSST